MRKAFIGLSLGNKTARSDKRLLEVFKRTMVCVSQFNLLIGDYINRHNYEVFEKISAAAAIEKSIEEGKRACTQVRPLVDGFGRVQTILSSSLCRREDFSHRYAAFECKYQEQTEFRKSVDCGVDLYLTRKHPGMLKDEKARDHCVKYQLEELVMFEVLAEEGHDVFVYAGAQLPVVKNIVSGVLKTASAIKQLTLVEFRFFGDAAV